MTLAQMHRRLAALEKQVDLLQEALEYERAVEGIRKGLESADRGEGASVKRTFAFIRRKHRVGRRR
jgi:hypothetical protein